MTSEQNIIRVAYYAALLSPDKDTQVGALILDKSGLFIQVQDCNRPPENLDLPTDVLNSPAKYDFIEHAERNVLFRAGEGANGCIMVAPYAPCCACARAMIAFRIETLICHKSAISRGKWADEILRAHEMLRSAGIRVEVYEGEIGRITNLIGGEEWNP